MLVLIFDDLTGSTYIVYKKRKVDQILSTFFAKAFTLIKQLGHKTTSTEVENKPTQFSDYFHFLVKLDLSCFSAKLNKGNNACLSESSTNIME